MVPYLSAATGFVMTGVVALAINAPADADHMPRPEMRPEIIATAH